MVKTMNDIIAFIRKAMSLGITVTTSSLIDSGRIFIKINEKDSIVVEIDRIRNLGSSNIEKECIINTPSGKAHIPITESENNLFKVLCDEVYEYEQNKALEFIDNFFKDIEKEQKITNVDELYD